MNRKLLGCGLLLAVLGAWQGSNFLANSSEPALEVLILDPPAGLSAELMKMGFVSGQKISL